MIDNLDREEQMKNCTLNWKHISKQLNKIEVGRFVVVYFFQHMEETKANKTRGQKLLSIRSRRTSEAQLDQN